MNVKRAGRGTRPLAMMDRMTEELFRQDPYLRTCAATVTAVGPEGIELDRTVFYPLGGGQAGDSGMLEVTAGSFFGRVLVVHDTLKAKDADGRPTGGIRHLVATAHGLQPGDQVRATIDWERRHRLMRFHTATHLLCHLVPQLVNGCSITPGYARLDFAMAEALDKDELTEGIARLVAAAHPLVVQSITEADLDANPALVKSMSVQPPRGTGSIRTIRIGTDDLLVDLQPCGGTHVANTGEIGAVMVTKVEKKGAMARRVVLGFAD